MIDHTLVRVLQHAVPGVLVEKIITEEVLCVNQIRDRQEGRFLNGRGIFLMFLYLKLNL